ncbi:MAG TPA: hypothetical protein VIG52_11550 [Methyloceanibacter sp.]|jgi:hypothetical protein
MTSYGMFIAPLALVALSASVAALPTARLVQPAQVLLIAEDAPSQSPDAATSTEDVQERYLATETIESCMKSWDPGTHMTKEAWRTTCERIKAERLPYVKKR